MDDPARSKEGRKQEEEDGVYGGWRNTLVKCIKATKMAMTRPISSMDQTDIAKYMRGRSNDADGQQGWSPTQAGEHVGLIYVPVEGKIPWDLFVDWMRCPLNTTP
jgi:hypothetical protein